MPGLPAWISPQLTQLVDAAPDGDQWLHEIKYDGYRMREPARIYPFTRPARASSCAPQPTSRYF
jgi:ATP-dependent DNA ligase